MNNATCISIKQVMFTEQKNNETGDGAKMYHSTLFHWDFIQNKDSHNRINLQQVTFFNNCNPFLLDHATKTVHLCY